MSVEWGTVSEWVSALVGLAAIVTALTISSRQTKETRDMAKAALARELHKLAHRAVFTAEMLKKRNSERADAKAYFLGKREETDPRVINEIVKAKAEIDQALDNIQKKALEIISEAGNETTAQTLVTKPSEQLQAAMYEVDANLEHMQALADTLERDIVAYRAAVLPPQQG